MPIKVYRPTVESIYLKMLLYGKPGAGKTTLAATASAVPEMSPVLYINAESGLLSITEEVNGIDLDNLEATDFGGLLGLGEIYNALAFENLPYRTVIFDSLTELQATVLEVWKKRLIPAGADGIPLSEEADKKNGWNIYSRSADTLKEILRKFRDLPMHVIFIAHDQQKEENGITVTRPALFPSFCGTAVGLMDVVAYLTTAQEVKEDSTEVVRLLTTTPRPTRVCKDRTPGGKLSGIVKDPDMTMLYNMIAAPRIGAQKGE